MGANMRVVPASAKKISSGHAQSLIGNGNVFSINGDDTLNISVDHTAALTFLDENNYYWKDRFSVYETHHLLSNYIGSTYPYFIAIDNNSTATIINYRLIRLDDTRISDEDWKFICTFYNNQIETGSIQVNNLDNVNFTLTNNNYDCSANDEILKPDSIIVLLSYDSNYYIEILSTEVNQVNDIDVLKNNIIGMNIDSLLLIRSDSNDNDNGEILNINNQNIILTAEQNSSLGRSFIEGSNTNCISGTEIEREIKGEKVRLIFTSNGLLLYGKKNDLINWSTNPISYIYLNVYRSNILIYKTKDIVSKDYNSFLSNLVAERYKDFDRSKKIPVGFLGLHFRIVYKEYQTKHESIKELNIIAVRNKYKDDIIYKSNSNYKTPSDNLIIVVLPTQEGPPYLKLEKYDL